MMDKNIIFLLTYCEADEWIKFNPPSKFKEKFSGLFGTKAKKADPKEL